MKALLFLLFPVLSWATCPVFNSKNVQVKNLHDGVFYLLNSSNECPSNIVEWNELIEHAGLKHQASMVANRGRNNPSMGSFSLFETVTGKFEETVIQEGEFFYGHFTGKHKNEIILDQAPRRGKLLIELIAWDYKKEAYNFYELVGQDQVSSRWFYRGDSFDALKDNEFLYRENGDQPKFGSRMRCSACHNSGGPIMKELSYPHNDWWTSKRSLLFGGAELEVNVAEYVKALLPAETFSQQVKIGIQKLESSPTYKLAKSQLSLQEQLRPLFCEHEINLESHTDMSSVIEIPTAFFVNPLIGNTVVKFARNEYEQLLMKYNLKFPENGQNDSDHAWLTPVKGHSDLLAIQSLIQNQVVSSQFVKSILQIDSGNPLFSKKRCDLLKRIPLQAENNWQAQFLQSLPQETIQNENHDLEASFVKLLKLRKAVYQSEISSNPRGQILEPGFRVVFPLESNL
jgi:hypothetical protein